MSALQKDFDFFSKKLEMARVKVEHKSYKKLMLFCGAVFLSIFMAYISGQYVYSVIENYQTTALNVVKEQENTAIAQAAALKKVAELNQLANRNKVIDKFKFISDTDANNFINYLKKHQNFYDSRVELISDSLMNANKSPGQEGLNESKKLVNFLTDYKEAYASLILTFSTLREEAKMNAAFSMNVKTINQMFAVYDKYKAGIVNNNPETDKMLQNYLYTKTPANVKYNIENKTISKYSVLEKEAISNTLNKSKIIKE